MSSAPIQRRNRNRPKSGKVSTTTPDKSDSGSEEMHPNRSKVSKSSSLDTVRIIPRAQKTPNAAMKEWDASDENDVELSLLDANERHEASNGFVVAEEDYGGDPESRRPLSSKDKRAMVLLVFLYLIQGVPLGLALGSVPFLLREHLSYSQIATFALSGYPYSLKLLWSPIVDAVFIPSLGRRKSWIIPMQLIIGTLMLYISLNVQKLLDNPGDNIYELTFIFTSLVMFSATQDIAVDGWALTLLSPENLSYASTCQTIGLNTGYFASFTVFLAFNSEAFATKWGVPHLTLSGYLRFWCLMSYAVTLWLIFVKTEDKETAGEDMSIKAVYKTIWNICKLPHIQSLIILHFFVKIGFVANDAVTQLKMVEKGLKREDLAIAVLVDFPFQILGGWLTAKWSQGDRPLRPWLWAFWPRLSFAVIAALIIYGFPQPPISTSFFSFLILATVLQSFTSTIQFVGITAFHTRISDPLIGGTYMTLLNTFSNLGGTWPKWFVLKSVDIFSIATCTVRDAGSDLTVKAAECVSEKGKALCAEINGECITERDGYYWTTGLCVAFGILFLVFYTIPTARKLQALPKSKWRVQVE